MPIRYVVLAGVLLLLADAAALRVGLSGPAVTAAAECLLVLALAVCVYGAWLHRRHEACQWCIQTAATTADG